MSEQTTKVPGAAPVAVDITGVADVIATMTRLITRLSEEPTIKAQGLGLTEWLGLRQLAAADGMRQGKMATALGVTRQRGNHIAKALKKQGLIHMAGEEGAKGGTITATEEGRLKAAQMDATIMAVLSVKLEGKGAALLQTRKRLALIIKAVPVAKGPKKKKDKKPKPAVDDDED